MADGSGITGVELAPKFRASPEFREKLATGYFDLEVEVRSARDAWAALEIVFNDALRDAKDVNGYMTFQLNDIQEQALTHCVYHLGEIVNTLYHKWDSGFGEEA